MLATPEQLTLDSQTLSLSALVHLHEPQPAHTHKVTWDLPNLSDDTQSLTHSLTYHPTSKMSESESTTAPPSAPATGLLFVYTERGPLIPEDEFEEWYNHEHIPLRMNLRGPAPASASVPTADPAPTSPLFLSCTRWTAADDKTPHHLALYTLRTPSAILEAPYVALSTSRTPHELDVLAKLAFLDRRVYKPLAPAPMPGVQEAPASKHGAFVSVVELTIKDDPSAEAALNEWYDTEHIPLLARVPGWVRSRRFVAHSVLSVTGTSVVSDTGAMAPRAAPGKYLAIHEWNSLDAFGTEEFKKATSTEWRKRVMEGAVVRHERRVFRFFRAWEQDGGSETSM